MTTELTFLTDLFLDDECPTPIKKRVAKRIKEVEQGYLERPTLPLHPHRNQDIPYGLPKTPIVASQSPSMQRMMAQNPDLIPKIADPVTPAAAAALSSRAALLAGAGKEKPEAGRTSPRKF